MSLAMCHHCVERPFVCACAYTLYIHKGKCARICVHGIRIPQMAHVPYIYILVSVEFQHHEHERQREGDYRAEAA